MKKNKGLSVFLSGFIKDNPTLKMLLGMCPALAVTTSAKNGVGMGLSAALVLVGSNFVISAIRKIVPDKVRIPVFITVIAGFVTIVQLLLQGFVPDLYDQLGIFIPLIVVNCIILARAEMFASKNKIGLSVLDGLGMGFGFTFALFLIGSVREILGSGTWFDIVLTRDLFDPAVIMILPPGGFLTFGFIIAIINKISTLNIKNEELKDMQTGCTMNCSSCGESGCGGDK